MNKKLRNQFLKEQLTDTGKCSKCGHSGSYCDIVDQGKDNPPDKIERCSNCNAEWEPDGETFEQWRERIGYRFTDGDLLAKIETINCFYKDRILVMLERAKVFNFYNHKIELLKEVIDELDLIIALEYDNERNQ